MDSAIVHPAFSIPFLFILLTFLSHGIIASAFLGINYGRIADNLPPPEKAVSLVQSIGASKVKIFDVEPSVITAFANTNIELVVGLGNQYLQQMRNPDEARTWVTNNIQPYLPATKISGIDVGNEVLTLSDSVLRISLFPAMQNVYQALVELGLEKQVFVTTTHALNILENSYPPSSGSFRQDLMGEIDSIVKFHKQTGSPFLINAYPFFVYKENPKETSLDFVLFRPSQGFADPSTNLHYDNMLLAQVDAVYNALASLDAKELAVHISETGWPSKGDNNEDGATPEFAEEYNTKLMKLVSERKGTPMRPESELNAYIFALFNEDLKPGPTSERNFGLFKPDGSPAYALQLTQPSGKDYGIGTNLTGSGMDLGFFFPTSFSPPESSKIPFYSLGKSCHIILQLLFYFFLF
ncbi:hypothetical protein Patl1_08629 [Pistacia atlantica]|uniref:Uncharacterized protein n=1 Tax=Pistacia atlantica TaxID=434234 RepID=A0ACC1AJ67_9ROSI|nr:hypothetical protein Patl1_08629 [Pistacia atlantica]